MLDIIVTHYNEPWEVGKKLFDILDLQRLVDFDSFRVILVNDGHENKLPDEYFSNRPYRVDQVCIEHAGVSAARNEGLRLATAEWVTFHDFDDMYSNIFAMKSVMDVLPAPGYDLLWARFYVEDYVDSDKLELRVRDDLNQVFCHAKYYRRSKIEELGLKFDTDLRFNEDCLFNTMMFLMCDYKRTGEIKAESPPYAWIANNKSVTHADDSYVDSRVGLYWRNKKVLDKIGQYRGRKEYCAMVARHCVDTYYTLNCPEHPPKYEPLKKDFIPFYMAHKEEMWMTDKATLKQIKLVSRSDYGPATKSRRPGQCVDETVSVTKWLRKIEQEANSNGGI